MPSATCPCTDCAHYLRCKAELLVCRAFAGWVDVGRTPGGASRDPSREAYVELYGFDDPAERYRARRQRAAQTRRAAQLAEVRRQARRETYERKRLIAAGLAEPLNAAERRKIRLARRRRRWKIAPELRARYLLSKRQDAIRRGRRRGAAPAGSEGNRLHRMEAQRRRREAGRERDGRTMSGPEYRALRRQARLTIWDVAYELGVTYGTAKQWQKPNSYPPARAVRWIEAVIGGTVDPIRGRNARGIAAQISGEARDITHGAGRADRSGEADPRHAASLAQTAMHR